MNRTAFLKVVLAFAVSSAGGAMHAATLTVFAAASLTDCLQEIGRTYQEKSGDRIGFNFAASSTLERQIEEGAPADIFFSADEAKMNALEAKGLIDKQTRRDRLANSLVIVVPADGGPSIRTPKDLASASVKHIALADPQAVPAGVYAKEYLRKVHLWDDLASKIEPMANVRAALAVVESGDADAGIVYSTDAAISKKVRVAYAVPEGDAPKIRYPMAVLKESRQAPAARAFVDYLDSNAAGRVFAKYGFTLAGHGP